MYKLFLSWRYLRTRYIALASIISVTLGVATLIVVNSVMAGFTHEMHKRLHGILSDIVFESHSLDGFANAEWHMAEIRKIVGDQIAGMTAVVHVPAMLNIPVRAGDDYVTRQVNVVGIDEETYAQVSDFSEYLKHPANREQLSFLLREGGYDGKLPESGWPHRRQRVSVERLYRQYMEQQQRQAESSAAAAQSTPPADIAANGENDQPGAREISRSAAAAANPYADVAMSAGVAAGGGRLFDESVDQHAGIIMGIAVGTVRHRDADGEVRDYYLCRPGDDVILTFPNAATPPAAVTASFTIVDLYESKMSEYDSSFVFVPLRKLQEMRQMIDPRTGVASVTSIQLRLKPGADLNEVRDKLSARFPPDMQTGEHYSVQTWRDMQGPLLSAVQLETTILNILLFLIIAVAGFGILATFFMIVVEKTRDVGILKSLGAPSRGVMSIFLSYGLSLGMVGSGVGMVLGLLFVRYINLIASGIEMLTGREVFDPTVYYFQQIPTIVDPFTVAWVTAGSVAIAVLASVLPALRAARLHPVEALRYE